MNRREYVMGVLGFVGVGVGGYYLLNRDSPQKAIDPQNVRILRNEGTEKIRIPASTGLTVIDFFSTYCSGCEEQISVLESIYRPADNSLSIISLTTQKIGDEFSESDLRDWWESHGGPWSVGIGDGEIASSIGVKTLPTVTILGPEGTIYWIESNVTADEIRNKVTSIRGKEGS